MWVLKDLYINHNCNQFEVANKVIRKIRRLSNDNNFEEINTLLLELDHTKSPDILIVSLARATYCWRQVLPEWDNFILKSQEYFKQRSEDMKYLLRGLY
jgi:hypothetical protein